MIQFSEYVSPGHPDKPIYAPMSRWGLFGEFQKDKMWEK